MRLALRAARKKSKNKNVCMFLCIFKFLSSSSSCWWLLLFIFYVLIYKRTQDSVLPRGGTLFFLFAIAAIAIHPLPTSTRRGVRDPTHSLYNHCTSRYRTEHRQPNLRPPTTSSLYYLLSALQTSDCLPFFERASHQVYIPNCPSPWACISSLTRYIGQPASNADATTRTLHTNTHTQ